MRPVVFQMGPYAAASAASIVTATAGGVGNLIVQGTSGVATLDIARRLLFTSSGTDTGVLFVVAGTDIAGNTQTETVAGGSSGSPTRSQLDYKTVTKVSTSGAAAGTYSVGTASTGGVASSPWVRLDDWAPPGGIDVQVVTTAGLGGGTINYTVQYTDDDPNSYTNAVSASSVTWFNSPTAALVTATTSQRATDTVSVAMARLLVNSFTSSACAAVTIRQQSVNPI